MSDDDAMDRVRGKGLPGSQPLGAPKRAVADGKVSWHPVPGKPHLEQSSETPPRLRTKQPLPKVQA